MSDENETRPSGGTGAGSTELQECNPNDTQHTGEKRGTTATDIVRAHFAEIAAKRRKKDRPEWVEKAEKRLDDGRDLFNLDALDTEQIERLKFVEAVRQRVEDQLADIPKAWRATDLAAAEAPSWLATRRIVRAGINLLVGDEGIGKSLLWVWITAAVTTGRALPEFGIPAREPAEVALILTEDDWSSAVRPRLESAGADLDRVRVLCVNNDGSGTPEFPRDIGLLKTLDPAPVLIVVDAWLDVLPPKLSVRDPQQAREALHPWRELAVETDSAVLLLTHTNRVASANARDKYGATGELRKKARVTLFAQQDDDGRLLVGPEKSNLSRPVPASAFTIDAVQMFPATAEDDGTVPRLRYVGDSTMSAREHIASKFGDEHGDDDMDRTEAEEWLHEYLQLHPGARSVDAKRDAKRDAGIAERTLQRACKRLKVQISRAGSPPVSTWTLPDDDVSISRGALGANGIFTGQSTYLPTGALGAKGGANEKVARLNAPNAPNAPSRKNTRSPANMPSAPNAPTNTHTGAKAQCQKCSARVKDPSITLCTKCAGGAL